MKETDLVDEYLYYQSVFGSYSLSVITELLKISIVFIALPPRPFKQARDEYNDDGLGALYHHLVLVLYEGAALP